MVTTEVPRFHGLSVVGVVLVGLNVAALGPHSRLVPAVVMVTHRRAGRQLAQLGGSVRGISAFVTAGWQRRFQTKGVT